MNYRFIHVADPIESPTLTSPLSVNEATTELAISGKSVPSASNVIPTKNGGSRVPRASSVASDTASRLPSTVIDSPATTATSHQPQHHRHGVTQAERESCRVVTIGFLI